MCGPGGDSPPPCRITSRCVAAIDRAGAWGSGSPTPDPLEGGGPGGATRLVDLSFIYGVLGDLFSVVLFFSFSLDLSWGG